MLSPLLRKVKSQRGSALISALFLMSIVALLAVTMLTRQNVTIRRTEMIFQEERLLAQANWVEIWAMERLRAVFLEMEEEVDFIALNQAWAEPLAEFQQEGIWLSGEIIDLQSQFNINNLLAEVGESTSAESRATEEENAENVQESGLEEKALPLEEEEKNPFDKETPFTTAWMFARLILQVSQESLTTAQSITENIMHWIKPEVTEWDDEYLKLTPPYQVGHQPLQSLSELRLIVYVPNEIIMALEPFITAYVVEAVQPKTENETSVSNQEGTAVQPNVGELFPINVNTTTAPVLAAVLNTDVGKANNLLNARPFYSSERLQEEMNGLNLTTESSGVGEMLSITSYYFLVKAVVRDDRRVIVQYSILKRDESGELAVIRRVQGAL